MTIKGWMTALGLVMGMHSVFAAEITVASAANLRPALEEIQREFQTKTGIVVRMIFGASGTLTAQIRQGAPIDIFLSADLDYPTALNEAGLTRGEPRIYAYGSLVLWTLGNRDVAPVKAALSAPYVRHIAIPHPANAPYGRVAVRTLVCYGLYETVQEKLVYGESIGQTNQFIVSGAADLGFTAKSSVLAEEAKGIGTWAEVEPSCYEPIAQGVVLLKAAPGDPEAVQSFYDYLFSAEAKAVFEKYGYLNSLP